MIKLRRRTPEVKLRWIIELKKWVEREKLPISIRQGYYVLLHTKNPDGTPMMYKVKSNKTDVEYDALSKTVTKHRQMGTLPWNYITDDSREKYQIIGRESLDRLLMETRDKYSRDIWRTQDNFVIVFVEKDALTDLVWRALGSEYTNQIPIIATRGYMSWGAFHKLIEKNLRQKYSPSIWNWHIATLFDYDQDGFDAEELLIRQFGHFKFRIPRYNFHRLGITDSQVSQYQLEMLNLDWNIMTKKQRDKYRRWFKGSNNFPKIQPHPQGQFCELEALHPRNLETEIKIGLKPLIDKQAIELEKEKQLIEKHLTSINSEIPDRLEFDGLRAKKELENWMKSLGLKWKKILTKFDIVHFLFPLYNVSLLSK